MNWKQFRELTKDVPDNEEVFFDVIIGHRYFCLVVDEQKTRASMTNDNTIILKEIEYDKEN